MCFEGLKYTSTETEAATDCRYLDYNSNPAMTHQIIIKKKRKEKEEEEEEEDSEPHYGLF